MYLTDRQCNFENESEDEDTENTEEDFVVNNRESEYVELELNEIVASIQNQEHTEVLVLDNKERESDIS